ncbi:hypothetical protein GYMLUDRAFT_338041 [Collybiopsis luxurians FD-317 M1]|nr:hypothetical protein GYMLUDRAFT_338041 [Collybiopsis luxurians FD-317 M1]
MPWTNSTYRRKGVRGRSQVVFWICMIVLLIGNTLTLADKIAIIVIDLRESYMVPSHNLDVVVHATTAALSTNTFTRDAYFGVNVDIMVADGIVVWRTWHICSEWILAKYFLVTLMASSVGINVADMVIYTVENASNRSITMDYIFSASSLAVNLLATFLIALTAWRHNRQKRRTFYKTRRNIVEKVFVLLIESAMIYSVCQVSS